MDDYTYFLSQFMNGVKLGSVYAMVAIGYSMVYGILRLINFAHGDIMTVGVYTILVLTTAFACPSGHVLISVIMAVLVGLTAERIAYRPLRTAGKKQRLFLPLPYPSFCRIC